MGGCDRLRVVDDQLRPELLCRRPFLRQLLPTDRLEVLDQREAGREAATSGHGRLGLWRFHEIEKLSGKMSKPNTSASNEGLELRRRSEQHFMARDLKPQRQCEIGLHIAACAKRVDRDSHRVRPALLR